MVNFVWVQSNSKDTKLKNLLIIWALTWFVTLLFHFTVVFFFWLILKSVFLVWVFLAVANVISLIFDIPVWVLQKYIKPKTFMVLSAFLLILTTLVFFKFVFVDWITWWELPKWSWDWFSVFTNNAINFILILIAASFYWLQSEVFWVTSYSYILNSTTPSEYAKYLSRYSIYSWAWNMFWLVVSWVLLAMNIKIALIIFLILTVFFIIFILKYFDNGEETIWIDNLKKLKIDSFKLDLWKQWTKISQVISTKNLMELTKTTQVLFLKPLEIKKNINFKEIYDFTVLNFKRFIKIIFLMPRNLMIFWLFFILMQFSFWDTFVSTFLIDFLEDLTKASADNPIVATWFVTGYILLWVIAIPGFILQDPFINLSKKIWEFNVLMIWTFLSWISLFLFTFFSDNVTIILILWLINSVWYAAVIWLWQWMFSEKYNILYAVRNNLKQIDSTVSAAPLKIVLNLANVVWLLLGSIILQLMWFKGFFFAFGGLLIWLFVYSWINYKHINESGKEWEWMFGTGTEEKKSNLEEFDWEVFN